MENIFNDITQMIGNYVPNLLGAIAILIIGWIVASIISKVVQSLLKKTNIDNQIAVKFNVEESNKPFQLEHSISRGVFWFLMLFVLVCLLACQNNNRTFK